MALPHLLYPSLIKLEAYGTTACERERPGGGARCCRWAATHGARPPQARFELQLLSNPKLVADIYQGDPPDPECHMRNRLALGLTVLNGLLLLGLIASQARSASAKSASPDVLRGRSLEIVDENGTV